jgi:uncharacterized protein YbjT (DUF2867 family)
VTAVTSLQRVLVLGATGYVGGRLVPRLLDAGYSVRVLVRDARRLEGRPWRERVEVVVGDALAPETLAPAFAGIDAAYYLIHSMQAGPEFHERDLAAARNCGEAARRAGTRRLVYLGGLGDPDSDLSEHLRSRQETGRALAEAGVPVTEFRAGVVVGSGSLSFEIVRDLVERLPVMMCPRWVYTRTQPIAIRNVLDYLVRALDVPESAGRVIEVGGSDVLTYGDMMRVFARVRGLRRLLIPVPVLTPRVSSYWVHWTTPVPSAIARPLIEGLRNEIVVRDDTARRLFPDVVPMDYETAVERALARLAAGPAATTWGDALSTAPDGGRAVTLHYREGMIRERRVRVVDASAADVFATVLGVGGERGWPAWNWAWRLRGAIDRLLGGVGFRRGRRDPDQLLAGEPLDFWRVEDVEDDRLLRLRAEMRVPGQAWLEFRVVPDGPRSSFLVQTAYFAPRGLSGLAYWNALYPFHKIIFSDLVARLAATAERGGWDDARGDLVGRSGRRRAGLAAPACRDQRVPAR